MQVTSSYHPSTAILTTSANVAAERSPQCTTHAEAQQLLYRLTGRSCPHKIFKVHSVALFVQSACCLQLVGQCMGNVDWALRWQDCTSERICSVQCAHHMLYARSATYCMLYQIPTQAKFQSQLQPKGP